MNIKPSTSGWNTQSEIDYLKRIGQFSEFAATFKKIDILKGYFSAAKKRVDWRGMDSEKIISFAKELILREKNKELK